MTALEVHFCTCLVMQTRAYRSAILGLQIVKRQDPTAAGYLWHWEVITLQQE